jgi:TM2 domain-containing membrane protein YozV
MNKSAQTNVFDLVFIALVFFLLLGGGLGYLINTMVGAGTVGANFSPLESLVINNWLVIIIIVFILALLWWSR